MRSGRGVPIKVKHHPDSRKTFCLCHVDTICIESIRRGGHVRMFHVKRLDDSDRLVQDVLKAKIAHGFNSCIVISVLWKQLWVSG